MQSIIFSLALCLMFAAAIQAQTTEFTYQGRLSDSTVSQPTNGTYQMQFALFGAASGGNQIGATVTNPTVQVSNGIFTVNLDFGASSFSGASRFLQVSVFSTTTNAYVALNPRQAVMSAPYSIKSLNAATADTATNSNNLGGVPANQYVQTSDSRLSDSRDPNAGSGNYVQNRTTTQAATNFNISGNGTAGGTLSGDAVNSNSQYNIGNARVLGVTATNNTFLGFSTGNSNTGINNSFFGKSAGSDNTSGGQNSFFGSFSGWNNTTGAENSFYGSGSGDTNTTGNLNSFFGKSAGSANTTGSSNTFIGRESGFANTTGFFNSFIGRNAGGANTTGFQNTFFGANAGSANVGGSSNTIIGYNAGSQIGIGNNNILIGNNANISNSYQSTVSNSIVIGSGASTIYSNEIVLGTNSMRLNVPGTSIFGGNVLIYGDDDNEGLTVYGYVNPYFRNGGNISICRNGGDIAECSSSRRYKTNILPFASGLSLINRLNPVTFDWKSDGSHDLGLVAEEVAGVEPLLVTYKNGQVEGVKYDRIGIILLNAVKEQQTEIEQQREQIKQQQILIDDLKKFVCQMNPQADVCKEKK